MKRFIIIFFFLTNVSFATSVTQSINTESQQTLYTQLIDSKIDNINIKVDSKIDNIKTDFDNKTKYLDSYSNNINWWFAGMAILFTFIGLLSWQSAENKRKDAESEFEQMRDVLKDKQKIIDKETDNFMKQIKQFDNQIAEFEIKYNEILSALNAKQESINKTLLHIEDVRNRVIEETEKEQESEEYLQTINDPVQEEQKYDIDLWQDKSDKKKTIYNQDYHFPNNKYKWTKLLYIILHEKLLELGENIKEDFKKYYIAFKINNNNFVDVVSFQKHLVCYINLSSGALVDEDSKARNMSNQGHWGNGDYEYKISSISDIDYFIGLAKQSYEKNKVR